MDLVKIEPVSPELADLAIQGEGKYLVPVKEENKMFPESWQCFLDNHDWVQCHCKKIQGYVTRGSELSCSMNCMLSKKAGCNFHKMPARIEQDLNTAVTVGHGARVFAERKSRHDRFRVIKAETPTLENPDGTIPRDNNEANTGRQPNADESYLRRMSGRVNSNEEPIESIQDAYNRIFPSVESQNQGIGLVQQVGPTQGGDVAQREDIAQACSNFRHIREQPQLP